MKIRLESTDGSKFNITISRYHQVEITDDDGRPITRHKTPEEMSKDISSCFRVMRDEEKITHD